jgi:hypothetical protein
VFLYLSYGTSIVFFWSMNNLISLLKTSLCLLDNRNHFRRRSITIFFWSHFALHGIYRKFLKFLGKINLQSSQSLYFILCMQNIEWIYIHMQDEQEVTILLHVCDKSACVNSIMFPSQLPASPVSLCRDLTSLVLRGWRRLQQPFVCVCRLAAISALINLIRLFVVWSSGYVGGGADGQSKQWENVI